MPKRKKKKNGESIGMENSPTASETSLFISAHKICLQTYK